VKELQNPKNDNLYTTLCQQSMLFWLELILQFLFPQTINIIYNLNQVIMAAEFTDSNFKTEVLDSSKLTVIDFWAEWCGPCRAIGPVIEELSKEYSGKVNVGKVNVDHNPQLSTNYGITSIPAILFVKNGNVVDKLVGAQPKANFIKKIEQHI
jgi:thioredoxin 1